MEASIKVLITFLQSKGYDVNDDFSKEIAEGCKKAFTVKKVVVTEKSVEKKPRKASTNPPYWQAFSGYVHTYLNHEGVKLMGMRSSIAGALWKDFKDSDVFSQYKEKFAQEENGKTKKLADEPAQVVETYVKANWAVKKEQVEKAKAEQDVDQDAQ